MSNVRHELKVWPRFFKALESGEKTFELRRNDRGYQPGDLLDLYEFDPAKHAPNCDVRCYKSDHGAFSPYHVLRFRVGFVGTSSFGCDLGEYVVLSLLPASPSP